MGGLVSGIEGLAKEGLTKVFGSETGREAWSFAGAKKDIGLLHPNAAAVMYMTDAFVAQRTKVFAKLDEPAQKLWEGIKADPQLKTAHDYKTSTIRDIHSTLTSKGSALASHTQQILGQPGNDMHTLETLSFQSKVQANRIASDQVLGPKYQNVIPFIQDLHESPNPQDHSIADMLIRVVSNDTHDTFDYKGAPRSRLANTIDNAYTKENKLRAKYPIPGQGMLPKVSTEATYKAPRPAERGLHSFMVNRLASLAVLPHVPMFGNLMSSPMQALVKGLVDMNDPQIKALSTASGILANTQHSMYYADLMGRTGKAAKIVGDGPAAFFYKMFHMPTFDWMRFHQLSLAASVGYHSATEWAAASVNGDRRALAELAEMKLDPKAIAARGGKLSPDEMQKAMFHYVNNRMFIDRPMDKSLRADSNVYMRSATMFHATVNSQFGFMQREIWKMVKTGDIKGLAQFGTTLGVLFPMVMPWLHASEVLGRTASITQARQAEEQDYQALAHPIDNPWEFTKHYADMLSYLGGFGVWHSLAKSAWNDRLATAVLGPVAGPVVTTAQDAWNAATKSNKKGEHNFNPLLRDASELSVPIIGKWAGHKLFPTLAEQKLDQPAPSRRRSRRR